MFNKVLCLSVLAVLSISQAVFADDLLQDFKVIGNSNAANYIPGQKKAVQPLNIKLPQELVDDAYSSLKAKKTPQEIARLAMYSAGIIVIPVGKGHSATGFFVTRNVIATNHHVIARGLNEDSVIVVGTKEKEADFQLVKVIADDPAHDVALVEVRPLRNAHFVEPVTLSGSILPPEIGDSIYLMGAPNTMIGTFTNGTISAFRDTKDVPVRAGAADVMQFNAPIDHGSSGSPIFNEKGELIGIAWGGQPGQASLNFGTPVKFIKALMKQRALI